MGGPKYQAEPRRKRMGAKVFKAFNVLRRIVKVLTFLVFSFIVYELLADRLQPELALRPTENAGSEYIIAYLPFLFTILCGIVAAITRRRLRYFFYTLGTFALIAILISFCLKGKIENGLPIIYYISLALSFICCIFVLSPGLQFLSAEKVFTIIPIVLIFLSCIFMVYRIFFCGFALKNPFAFENGVKFPDLLSVHSPFIITFLSGIIGAILKKRRQRFTVTLVVLFGAYCLTGFPIALIPSAPLLHNIAYCITMIICVICCFCVLDPTVTDWSASGSSYYDKHDIINDMSGDEEFFDPDGCDIDVSDI